MFDSARKSLQPSKTSDECLQAMKEDLSVWLNLLYELNIDTDEANLLDYLDTGVLLCRHANAVNVVIMNNGTGSTEYNVLTKNRKTDTDDITADDVALQCRSAARPETFQARDNIATFLWWCRDGCLQLDDVITFETEDLVRRRNERNVVLCLLEVARRGAKFGMQAPELVRLEAEIDAEIASGEGEGSLGYDKDELVARLMAWRAEMEREKREMRERSPVESSRDSGKCTRESEDDTISTSRTFHDRDDVISVDAISEEFSEQGSVNQENIAVADCRENGQSSAPLTNIFDSPATGSVGQTSSNKESAAPKAKRLQYGSHRSKSNSVSKSEKYKTSDTNSSSSPASSKSRDKKAPVKRHALIEFDMMTLDEMVRRIASRCTCATQFPIIRISEGKYMVGENLTLIFVRILRHHVMVRIGGGWDTLENYLSRHDPCRCQMHGRGGTAGGFVELSSTIKTSSTPRRTPSARSREQSGGPTGLCVISSTVDSSKLHLASQRAVNHSRLSKQSSLASSSSSSSSPQKPAGRSVLNSDPSSVDNADLDEVPCDDIHTQKTVSLQMESGVVFPDLNDTAGYSQPLVVVNSNGDVSHDASTTVSMVTSKQKETCNSNPNDVSRCVENSVGLNEVVSNYNNCSSQNHLNESHSYSRCNGGVPMTPAPVKSNNCIDQDGMDFDGSNQDVVRARRSLNFSSNSNPASRYTKDHIVNESTAAPLEKESGDDISVSEEQVDSSDIFKQIELGLRYLSSDEFDADPVGGSSATKMYQNGRMSEKRELLLPHPNTMLSNGTAEPHEAENVSPANTSATLKLETKLTPGLQRKGNTTSNLVRTNKASSFRESISQKADSSLTQNRPGSHFGALPSRPASAGVRSGRVQTRPPHVGLSTEPSQIRVQSTRLRTESGQARPQSVGLRTGPSQTRPQSAGLRAGPSQTRPQSVGLRTKPAQARPQSAKVQSQVGSSRSQSMRVSTTGQSVQLNTASPRTSIHKPVSNSSIGRRASFQSTFREINEVVTHANEQEVGILKHERRLDSIVNERRNSVPEIQSPCSNSRKDAVPGRSRIPQPCTSYGQRS